MNRREILKMASIAFGAGFSGSLSLRVLAGEVPTAQASRALFKDGTKKMVATLTELIIPATDTPGAIEAGTPTFVEMMVSDWYKDGERKIFFDGLVALDDFCKAQYKKSFNACTQAAQIAALTDAEAKAKTYIAPTKTDLSGKHVDENTPFFTKLKELTVIGYFSSEVGVKQELAYNPMPMRYEGDYDFDKIGHQWS